MRTKLFDEEVMNNYPLSQSNLPPGWVLGRVSDIATTITPGFASGAHNQTGTGTAHLRPMNIDRNGQLDMTVVKFTQKEPEKTLKGNDILFNNTNSPELVGKTAYVTKSESGYGYSNHMTRVQVHHSSSSKFFAKQLHFLWGSGYMASRCTNHVNQASISSKVLSDQIPIQIPPTEEQHRIVEKLEELLSQLDAGAAELKAAQKKLELYRQSLLKAAVEGRLTTEWREKNTPTESGAQLLDRILTERRERWEAQQQAKFEAQGKKPPKDWQKKYPEPVKPDTTGLPALPEGWVWARVDQLGTVQLGRQRSPDKLKGTSPTKYIRAANITEDGINLDDVLSMDFNEEERETFYLKHGDVLLTEASGSAEHVGRPAIWTGENNEYCFQNTVLRFSSNEIKPDFSYFSFLAMQKLGIFRKTSGGVGINHLSAGKFSKILMATPSAQEQDEIVFRLKNHLSSCERLLKDIERSIRLQETQRQNILRAAFAGELVPQDPNDEPASELFARIQAERAAQAPQKAAKPGKKSSTEAKPRKPRTRKPKEET